MDGTKTKRLQLMATWVMAGLLVPALVTAATPTPTRTPTRTPTPTNTPTPTPTRTPTPTPTPQPCWNIDASTEGFDPARQITSQMFHPNVQIVLDRSGSLTFTGDPSPANGCSGTPPTNYNSCWAYDGSNYGYVWWEFKYTNAGSTWSMAGAVPSAADFTISHSSASFLPRTGSGNGFWVRAGRDQIWSALVASSSYTTILYVNGNPGWAKGTQVTVSGASTAGDNGTYYTCAAITPTTTGNNHSGFDNGLYSYTTLSTTYASGSCGTTKIFASSPYPAWMKVQKVGTTAGQWLWYFMPPSRMASIKNALGDSVTVYQPSVARAGTDGSPDARDYYLFDDGSGPVNGAYFDWYTKAWVSWSPTTSAPAGDPAYTTAIAPADLVGNSADKVNWGFGYYYGSTATLVSLVVPDDSAQKDAITPIEAALDTVAGGGLNPYDGTPTVKGLDYAKNYLSQTSTHDLKLNCGRNYATILVTDGESNNCNKSGGAWPGTCNSYTTLATLKGYPPGRADELFLETQDTTSGCTTTYVSPTNVQTFVIGVSNDVAVCELDLTAYFGRTDASAGAEVQNNPLKWQGSTRLPQNTTGATTLANFAANFAPSGDHYAFFANSATDLAADFQTIVASFGVGNYTTSPPSVSGATSVLGNMGFVPAVDYPSWKGHLYAYDLDPNHTTAAAPFHPLLWDSGAVMANTVNPNNGVVRRIVTWDPSATPNPSLQWIAGQNAPAPSDTGGAFTDTSASSVATVLNGLCGSCGITDHVVDFMRGYDGTLTGTRRSWTLGAIMNCTPVVTGAVEIWKQNQLADHSAFEAAYGSTATGGARHPLVWVGSSDGMVHAFDLADGAEIIAMVPPDLLFKQVELYAEYLRNPSQVTGENKFTDQHIYGVSNSLRFADIYDAGNTETANGKTVHYRTVLYVTEAGRTRKWTAGTSFHVGDVVKPVTANGHIYKCTVAGTTAKWVASASHVVGDVIQPTADNGHIYKCTVAGTSSSTEPTWPRNTGGTVTDGTVHWAESGPFGGGLSGSTEPTWPTGSGATVVDNGVTWTEYGVPGGTGVHAVDITHAYPGRQAAVIPAPFAGPTAVPTTTATPTWTPNRTATPTPTSTPTCGPRNTDTPTPTPTQTPSGTATPTPTPQTTPYPTAVNFDNSTPVIPLWSAKRTASGTLADMGQTWSMPALGASGQTQWELTMGSGYDERYPNTGVQAKALHLDPLAGTATEYDSLTGLNGGVTNGARVRNQAFADSVMLQTTAPYFQPDNIVTQSVQADLNGQVWTFDPTGTTKTVTSIYSAGADQPIYFSPAVVGYPAYTTPTHDLYAFGTGCFYETSPHVSGFDAFGNPYAAATPTPAPCPFFPELVVAARELSSGSVTATTLTLNGLHANGYCLGRRTQLVAPALILTSQSQSAFPEALFLVYDPDDRCGGTTSIIVVSLRNQQSPSSSLDLSTLGTSGFTPTISIYDAGQGASGGFALAGSQVFVSKSYTGQGGNAYMTAVPGLWISSGTVGGNVSWWRELQ